MLCSKKVILTGATGTIGREAIAPLLDAGFEIFALQRNAASVDFTEERKSCVHAVYGDLFDVGSLTRLMREIKPNYLLHFAWCARGDYLTSDLNYKFRDASLEMLRAFKMAGGMRAVFSGTCFEYEFKDSPLSETDPTHPITLYARCKDDLRRQAQEYCAENGIDFSWGLIFYVFGQNEDKKRLTPYIIDTLIQDKKVTIQNGSLVRDYAYTKDIAAAFVKILDGVVTGLVNVCAGEGISLGDYALLLARKLGKSHLVEIRQEPTEQPPIIIGSTDKLFDQVGFRPKYSTDEAIDEILSAHAGYGKGPQSPLLSTI